jgi:hypothetical protein
MKTFSVDGRCVATPPPADWREQLILMLGAKPRRIGTWAELGLYGALRCMADAAETSLPDDALLVLASRRGTYAATNTVLAQMQDDLPMPLAFLQTLSSQLLAHLASQLNWQGNATFIAGSDLNAVLALVAAQAGKRGVLLGFVDEFNGGATNWLRLRPVQTPAGITADTSTKDNILLNGISILEIFGPAFLASYEGQ